LDAARIEEVQCSDVIWVTLGEKGGGYAIESGSGAVMITGWWRTPPDCFAGSKRHRAASRRRFAVAKPSPERRCANNNSARYALKDTARQEKAKTARAAGALFQSSKRQSEYQGYRGATPDRIGSAMPILIGAAMIAAAILLSTLITAVGTRFVGMESPNEENLWLIDRLTGSVYKCQAPERGKAACEAEVATGSLGERSRH
jgi:hypothetical protein